MTVRVLHAVPDMNSGGIENYIMNMYRLIDRDKVQYDFLVHHAERGFFDDEIESLGGTIYRLPVLDSYNVPRYLRDLKLLFDDGSYEIVHGHAASLAYLYLGAAERSGVKNRIAHSHGASFLKTPKGYAKRLLFMGAKKHANIRLACSTEAGKYLFGDSPFQVALNAIDPKRFAFDERCRAGARSELGIACDSFVVGHIGRFNLQKNHSFLLDIFKQLKQLRPDSVLLLVGKGELKEAVKKKVRTLELEESVLFVDVTQQPEKYYCAMDCLVMPSLFEGLPLTGIEAQCAGLPCFFSTSITREVSIGALANFIDLSEGDEGWAREVLSSCVDEIDRSGCWRLAGKAGYDVRANAEKMQRFYESLACGGGALV